MTEVQALLILFQSEVEVAHITEAEAVVPEVAGRLQGSPKPPVQEALMEALAVGVPVVEHITVSIPADPGKAKQRESLEIQGQTYILAEVVARVDTQVVAQ